MPSPPRLTAADAETLLVSAGFLFLDRRGQHRIYGRHRTRVVVPFDGRPALHPKIVRMIVESMERSRPEATFEVDKTLVGMGEAVDAGAWVIEPGDPVFGAAPASPPPASKTPPKAPAPKPPPPRPAATQPAIPPTPVGKPAAPPREGEDDEIELPPKPKGAWS